MALASRVTVPFGWAAAISLATPFGFGTDFGFVTDLGLQTAFGLEADFGFGRPSGVALFENDPLT